MTFHVCYALESVAMTAFLSNRQNPKERAFYVLRDYSRISFLLAQIEEQNKGADKHFVDKATS